MDGEVRDGGKKGNAISQDANVDVPYIHWNPVHELEADTGASGI